MGLAVSHARSVVSLAVGRGFLFDRRSLILSGLVLLWCLWLMLWVELVVAVVHHVPSIVTIYLWSNVPTRFLYTG